MPEPTAVTSALIIAAVLLVVGAVLGFDDRRERAPSEELVASGPYLRLPARASTETSGT
jgi:hypothetical protein